jgi:hypothetical protein
MIDQLIKVVNEPWVKTVGGWKMPNSHHVTSLFIGGSKEKLNSD